MKQIRHLRTSKKGKKFVAGKRIAIPKHLTGVKRYTNKNYIATGLDSKGRMQYVYPKHVKTKNASKKFKRIFRLANKKKDIMSNILQDVEKGNTEAEAVYTIYKTGFRPGSDKDTKAEKQAYGAITLLKEHVKVKPKGRVEFDFIGKKGVHIKKEVKDKLLSDIMVERKQDKHLFDTSAEDVRAYFDKKTKGQFQLKDLRTLKAFDVADQVIDKTKIKDPVKIKKEVVAEVSKELGNTESVAAQSYIAPKLEKFKNEK